MKQACLNDLLLELWFRERESRELCWTTKEGKRIPIKDMTDIHLLNTINMLKKAKALEEMEEDIDLVNDDTLFGH